MSRIREYLPEQMRPAAILLYTAVAMILLEYVASSRFFIRNFGGLAVGRHGLYPQLWWALVTSAVYLLPAAALLWIFRESLADYGMKFKVPKKHFLLYAAMYLLVLPLVIYASTRSDFRQVYPFFRGAFRADMADVFFWEAAYLFQFFALEFFFRGFLVLGLERFMGRLSVWVAMVPYCMIHFHKPMLEATAAIVAGLVLGEVALRTRSILGGVIVHSGVALTMDLLALGVFR